MHIPFNTLHCPVASKSNSRGLRIQLRTDTFDTMASSGSSNIVCEIPQAPNHRQHYEGLNANLQATTLDSSTSSPDSEKCAVSRPPRTTYSQEQEDAIRFLRDDLGMTWVQVEEAYNCLYYADGTPWEWRTMSGLQSRYYRLMPVIGTKNKVNPRPHLGILSMNPERRYWWMSSSQVVD